MSASFVVACPTCPFTGRYTSQAIADAAHARHSCAKNLRDAELTARGRARDAAVDRTPKPCRHPRAHHEHGTRNAYTLDGCRCVPCATARSAYNDDLEHRRAYGHTGWVPAAPIREHLAVLRAAGVGIRVVQARTGVARTTLTRLADGTTQRVRDDIARRILALPATTATAARGALVDATGTRRRLQALATLGWTIDRLAAHAGLDRQPLDSALNGARRGVLARTAHAVADLYDQLWDTPPPAGTPYQDAAATRARARARAAGWLPPLTWDEDTIDDPAATPTLTGDRATQGGDVDEVKVARALAGVPCALNRAERELAVPVLVATGMSDLAIARLTGVSDRTIIRDRERLGLASRWRAS